MTALILDERLVVFTKVNFYSEQSTTGYICDQCYHFRAAGVLFNLFMLAVPWLLFSTKNFYRADSANSKTGGPRQKDEVSRLRFETMMSWQLVLCIFHRVRFSNSLIIMSQHYLVWVEKILNLLTCSLSWLMLENRKEKNWWFSHKTNGEHHPLVAAPVTREKRSFWCFRAIFLTNKMNKRQ